MTGSDETLTTKELAEILGKVKTSILRRAEKEGWVYIKGKNKIRRFIVAGLPEDVRIAVITKQCWKNIPITLYEREENREAQFVLPEPGVLWADIQKLDEQIEKIRDRKKWRMMCLSEIEETTNEGAG